MKKHRMVTGAVLALTFSIWAASPAPAGANEAVVSVPAQASSSAEASSVQIFPATEVKLTESQQKNLDKIYDILPELGKLNVQYITDPEAEGRWSVFLGKGSLTSSGDRPESSARLEFDAGSGELIDFDFHNPQWASEKTPSPEYAKQKAAEFVRQLLGDKADQYKVGENLGYSGSSHSDDKGNQINWTAASVQFNPLIHGVPLLNWGFRVNVDVAGHITGFSQQDSMQDLSETFFPDPKNAISLEEAERKYAQEVQMKLSYRQQQPLSYRMMGQPAETRPALVYTPNFQGSIDALAGEPVEDLGYVLGQPERRVLTGEGKELVARTPEEGVKLLAEKFGVDMNNMELLRSPEDRIDSQGKRNIKDYTWRTPYDLQEDRENPRYVTLHTEADTGKVLSFSLQDEASRGKEGKITLETARQKAVQFVQPYLEPGSVEMELVSWSSGQFILSWVDQSKIDLDQLPVPISHFVFQPLHQGIPVVDRGYSVSVNEVTGKVVSYVQGGLDPAVELPDAQGVVAAEVAKAEYLKTHPLRLVYLWPEWFGQRPPAPNLVYTLEEALGATYIDALTGKTVIIEENNQ